MINPQAVAYLQWRAKLQQEQVSAAVLTAFRMSDPEARDLWLNIAITEQEAAQRWAEVASMALTTLLEEQEAQRARNPAV